MYVYCVCDPSVSRCSLHMADLWVCMRDVISLRSRYVHVECIFPFGMLCLSAWSTRQVVLGVGSLTSNLTNAGSIPGDFDYTS